MSRMIETMMELKGKGVAPGYASGPAFVFRSRHNGVVPSHKIEAGDVEREIQRLQSATDNAIQDLKRIRGFLELSLGEHYARIVDFHVAVLSDEKYVGKIKNRIRDDLENAALAVDSVIMEIVRMFETADPRFLTERIADIQDIGNRLLRHLDGKSKQADPLPKDAMLVADEIFPSDTVYFDRNHLKGIISERGGETSHAAILARALGIPMVIAVENATEVIENGMHLLVDGSFGSVTVLPSVSQQSDFTILGRQYEKEASAAEAGEVKACITSDGIDISLWANIGFSSEAESVLRHNLKGVGLLRSEYLFMKTDIAPDADVQENEYRGIAANLQGAVPLTIRTLDLGGDKNPVFLPRLRRENPGMDLRGLRFSLNEKKLFKEQIAAILRLSTTHPVRILLPMVADVGDLVQAKEMISEIAFEEGVEDLPPIGSMIETPSAVLLSEEIAAESDFLSIGTNDLAQFILAADRLSTSMMNDYFALHPAVLRAIRAVSQAAEKAGRSLGVCGEIAGDPVSACILTGLGIRHLSMSPIRAARVRQAIRSSNMGALQELAQDACGLSSASGMKTLYKEMETVIKSKTA